MKRYSFNFVALWRTQNWVVGTCTYNAMAQGQTLGIALDRLKATLVSEAVMAQQDGQEPFLAHGDPTKAPFPEFTLHRNEDMRDFSNIDYDQPDKTKRFIGLITIEVPQACAINTKKNSSSSFT